MCRMAMIWVLETCFISRRIQRTLIHGIVPDLIDSAEMSLYSNKYAFLAIIVVGQNVVQILNFTMV